MLGTIRGAGLCMLQAEWPAAMMWSGGGPLEYPCCGQGACSGGPYWAAEAGGHLPSIEAPGPGRELLREPGMLKLPSGAACPTCFAQGGCSGLQGCHSLLDACRCPPLSLACSEWFCRGSADPIPRARLLICQESIICCEDG